MIVLLDIVMSDDRSPKGKDELRAGLIGDQGAGRRQLLTAPPPSTR
jgi:hypothetical protein